MAKNGWKNGKQQYWCKCNTRKNAKATIKQPTGNVAGISEQQLRQKHDTRYIIKTACENLQKGTFYKNSEFIARAGVSPGAGYRDIIDHPDFEGYKGKAGGEVYWSHKESIDKLKKEGVLR